MGTGPATVRDAGGLAFSATAHRPPGVVRGGGFDPDTITLYLGPGGHPDGMAMAGGSPEPTRTPGISVFETGNEVYWANDSISLPKSVTAQEATAIQHGLEVHFARKRVVRIARIGDVPRADSNEGEESNVD